MSSERRIKTLKLRQKSIVTSLNLIKTFVDGFNEETQANEVPVRLESLIRLWSDFNTVQSELETLDEAAIDAHLKERTTLESVYYHVKGFLLARNKIQITPTHPFPNQSEAQSLPSASQVRLPDVKLPVFDGKLENWMNFHDLFVSLVHSSIGLSNIQKFYYLRSFLSHAALQLIQTIPISANNYPVAWNLLLDHFQNSARLKQSYVDALFDFVSLKRESATELHSLVEKFDANVRVLQQLGEHTEYWDILLIRMLSIRLDPTTRRDWEEHSSTKEAITFKDLTTFIQRRVTVLQSIQTKTIEAQPPAVSKQSAQRSVSSYEASPFNVGRKCILCSDYHPLYLCSSFSKLDVEAKEREIHNHQLCRNCLRMGHQAKDCLSSSSCHKCQGRHHTQLCSRENSVTAHSRTSESSHSEAPSTSSSEQPKASVSATIREPASYASTGQTHNVLLATAVVKLVDDNGTAHLARALLDSGSECCFITESFSKQIKAQRKTISVPISGIGQSSSHARFKIVSTIRSRVSDYSTSAEFLVLPKVTIDLPTASFDTSSWQIPPGIHLADPSFHEAKQIDIVIGADIFFELFKVPGRIPLGDSLPTLVNSVLGWIVSGKVSHGTPTKPVVSNVALLAEQPRFPEHFRSTEEGATSSSVEQNSEYFRRAIGSITDLQYNDHSPLKHSDGNEVLEQAESRLSTACPVAPDPSFIAYVADDETTEPTLFFPETFADQWKRLAPSRTASSKLRLHSSKQIVLPISTTFVHWDDGKYLHQFLITVLRLRYWHTGARNPVNTTMQSSIINRLHALHCFATRRNSSRKPNSEYSTLARSRKVQLVITRKDANRCSNWSSSSSSHVRTIWEVEFQPAQKHFGLVLGFHIRPHNEVETQLIQVAGSFYFPDTEVKLVQLILKQWMRQHITTTWKWRTHQLVHLWYPKYKPPMNRQTVGIVNCSTTPLRCNRPMPKIFCCHPRKMFCKTTLNQPCRHQHRSSINKEQRNRRLWNAPSEYQQQKSHESKHQNVQLPNKVRSSEWLQPGASEIKQIKVLYAKGQDIQ